MHWPDAYQGGLPCDFKIVFLKGEVEIFDIVLELDLASRGRDCVSSSVFCELDALGASVSGISRTRNMSQ